MKKIIPLLLAVVLTFAIPAAAFAEDNTSAASSSNTSAAADTTSGQQVNFRAAPVIAGAVILVLVGVGAVVLKKK